MPFKGDERLGGPHDNEASLNGSSDGPTVPPYGTYLRTDSNVVVPIGEGGEFMSFVDANGGTYEVSNTKATVDVKADGIGGEYYDWSTKSNQVYFSYGTEITSGQTTFTSYFYIQINGYEFEAGNYGMKYIHDGSGSYTSIQVSGPNFVSDGYYYTTTQGHPLYSNYYGVDYQVGVKDLNHYADGSGGSRTTDGSTYPYPDYTSVGTRSENLYWYVYELSESYQYGTQSYDVYVYGGSATDSGAVSSVSYYSYGTQIGSSDYYWTGYGYEPYYYYQEPAPSAGTPTGNTNSGTNWININGTDYDNGTFSGSEYHDGSGGTYWSYSYSYQSYGYTFTSVYVDDGMGGGYTEYYNSDGNGSYYTST